MGWLVRLSLLGLLAAVIGVGYFWFTTPLPPETPARQTTVLFDSAGGRLAALHDAENRESVPLSKMPATLLDAVIAAEDRSFFDHAGIDPRGVGRAVVSDVKRELRNEGALQGGSTITQQYVKIVYTDRRRTPIRKLREAVLAVKLERKLSKRQILERYLNTVYFGRGAYGVQAAAGAYFDTDVSELSLSQSAYLAGLIRAPSPADAAKNPALAVARRDRVLDAMVANARITAAVADGLRGTRVRVIPRAPAAASVSVDETMGGTGAEHFVDLVRRELIDRYGVDDTFGGGLRVTTTLDAALQRLAHEAVYEDVLGRPSDPDGALVALDHDGRVRAMIGGRSWTRSRVNLAVGRRGGGSGMPGGSTFKPFVLAAALENGVGVDTLIEAPAARRIGKWRVRNADGRDHGAIDVAEAMRLSVNTAFAELITAPRVGPKRVARTAHALGIRSDLAAVPALALGASDVSALEMASAYLSFANHGTATEPSLIAEVRTADGKVLEAVTPRRTRAVSARTADAVTATLEAVVSSGTGRRAADGVDVPIAGKTGTTDENRDAWFVGYTPERCCAVAVWVGYGSDRRPMTSVRGRAVTGSTLPAEIFARFLGPAVNGLDVGEFTTVESASGASGAPTSSPGDRLVATVPVDDTATDEGPGSGGEGGPGGEGGSGGGPIPAGAGPVTSVRG